MKLFGTIGSVNNPYKEHPTLMGFTPSKKINRFDHSEKLLEIKKPTVACRLKSSMNFWHPTHFSRLAPNQHPRNLKSRSKSKELLYD